MPLIAVCLCPPGAVGMSPSCVMVAASVSCSHGHTPDATAGTKQRPAASASATATAAATGGYRLDRPLQRQPHAIPRAIAGQLQPAHGTIGDALKQSQQLKQPHEQTMPLLVPSLMVTNLTPYAIPIAPADHSPLYMRNKRFKLWGSTRTALSALFRDNVSQLRKQRKHKKS